MSLRSKLLAATVIAGAATAALSSGALAYDGHWYIGAGAGWFGPEHVVVGSGQKSDGWMGYASVGRPLSVNPNVRGEFEYSYRTFDVNAGTGNRLSGGGDVTTHAFMLNFLYDFSDGPIVPYVGIGGGAGFTEFDVKGPGITANDDAWAFAGQALAGLEWKLTEKVSLDLGYRYFMTDDMDVAQNTGVINEDIVGHTASLGLRIKFGQEAPPPPPPPPAPPPVAPTVFKIFFPWDVYTLTEEAKNTVDEIAAQYRDQKVTRIFISGNTDTSGASDYNMGLGGKRADSVKAELVAQGIPESLISTETLGETNPAVQTGDNVREPLNRRAEVTITLESGPSS